MNPRHLKHGLYELLSSMRFAVSLLVILAIASAIGTILKQGEPYANYVIQFGQFWFGVFDALGLYDVYHSSWFLTILAFLILSTGLCVSRNTPLMLREMRSFREHAGETSLRAFSHQAEFNTTLGLDELKRRIARYLDGQGFRAKEGTPTRNGDVLIAAKTGSYHRLGYMLTHAGMMVICLGFLLDGNPALEVQQLLGWKKPETRDLPQDRVPAASRLSISNPAFRGSVTISEGSSADVAFLSVADGYLVQELPFEIQLKKFRVEHYPSGQPKSFESDVVLIDKTTQKETSATIAVNHPLIHDGIALYQANLGDGGSKLTLKGWNILTSSQTPFDLQGVVKQSSQLTDGSAVYTIEFTDFRRFNIEDFANGADSRGDTWQNMRKYAETGRVGAVKKDLRNLGPSFQYKIRDAQGQAREYFNYMQPIELEDHRYLVSGMRSAPNEPFRYLRIPLDGQDGINGFMRLRAVLLDKKAHPEIARRFADFVAKKENIDAQTRIKLIDSAIRVLGIFADGGFDAMAGFIEKTVPASDQEKAAQAYVKVLETTAVSAYAIAQTRAGLSDAMDDNALRFVRDGLNTTSDLFAYGAPVYLQLTQFDEVMASGLQLTRSPGKKFVYGGSVLLVLGVFFMFYVRERRMWLLVEPHAGSILFAMSTNRKTMDFETEFGRHKEQLAQLLKE